MFGISGSSENDGGSGGDSFINAEDCTVGTGCSGLGGVGWAVGGLGSCVNNGVL